MGQAKPRIDRSKIFLAVISGFAMTMGFPVVGQSWIAGFALIFLLFAIRNVTLRQGIILGIVTGMLHFASLLYWLIGTMHIYGYLPLWLSVLIFIPLVFYLSLYVGAFAGLSLFFCSGSFFSLLLMPVFWVCLEYIRGVAFSGFPWGLIGYTQYCRLHLIQIADITGVYGVSFAVVMFNALIFPVLLYLKNKKWQDREISFRSAMTAILLMISFAALITGYGYFRLKAVDHLAAASKKLNISVIQGNIEQTVKWDLKFRVNTIEKYIRLSEQAAITDHPDLIVWPETATPFYFNNHIEMTKMVLQAIQSLETPFVIGSPSVAFTASQESYYNSAYLISSEGNVLARTDKVHLVPFGEYVPLRKYLPFIRHLVAQVGEFKSGKKGDTLKWDPTDIGVLICYEIIFPSLAEHAAANNAGLLINITNDAWFGKSSAPYQHFSMAVFRAVENRRSLVRAANTGISGFIDPAGRISAHSSLFVEAAETYTVPVIKDRLTIYTRHGDLFVLACFMMMGASIILRFMQYIKKNKTTTEALCQ